MNNHYTIIAQNIAFLEDMNEDDQSVVGIYTVDVTDPENYDPDQICNAILNRFHENYGIEVLDDFDIQVYDRNGDQIFETDEDVNSSEIEVDDPVFITDDTSDEWYDSSN